MAVFSLSRSGIDRFHWWQGAHFWRVRHSIVLQPRGPRGEEVGGVNIRPEAQHGESQFHMLKLIMKWPGWLGMNKFLARLVIYGCLMVVGCCVVCQVNQVVNRWPLYRGSSVLWDWGANLQSADPEARTRAAAVLSDALIDESISSSQSCIGFFYVRSEISQ
jgi:hypothetical protein